MHRTTVYNINPLQERLMGFLAAALLHGGLISLFAFSPHGPPVPAALNSFQVVNLPQLPASAPAAAVAGPTAAEERHTEPEPEPVVLPATVPPPVALPRQRVPAPEKRPPEKKPLQPTKPKRPETMQAPAPAKRTPAEKTMARRGQTATAQSRSTANEPAFTPPVGRAGYLDNPAPIYPIIARRRGLEGMVVLRVKVDGKGRVESVSVRNSSGHAILDRAAKSTVQSWRFRPATRLGQRVAAEVNVPIRFSLKPKRG